MRRRLADRRSSRRYDIVGELGGALDAAVRLPVRNIGMGGALLESPVPLVPASVHHVALSWNGVDVASTARVCHVVSAVSSDGERQYLIGVEFLSPAHSLTEQLARSVAAPEGSANGVVTVAVYSGSERRRTPRLTEVGGAECRVALHSPVRLLDISAGGAWVGCDAQLCPGTRAQVTTLLAGVPFVVNVQIQRVGSSQGRGAPTFGTKFLAIDEQSRRSLDAFLRKATE